MSISNLWIEANSNFKKSIGDYLPYFSFFVLISFIDLFADYFIPMQFDTLKLIMSLCTFVLTIVASILFLKTQKRDSVKGDFWFLLIPFFLYSIYYSIVGLIGLVFLFIPGIIFYYAPLIGAFHQTASPFKLSLKIAKKYFAITAFLSISSLLLEAIPFLLKLIPNKNLGLFTQGFFSVIETYIYMILMLITVKIYYLYIDSESV